MRNIPIILLSTLFCLFLVSCQEEDKKAVEVTAMMDTAADGGADDLVLITKEQFEASDMLLGQIETMSFPNTIRANGTIDVPPKSRAAVSVYHGGYVQGLDLLPGQTIRKGQVLFVLENPDFIQMQQDYLEAKEQLAYLQSDYERQKTLAAEKISSQKNFLKAESDFKVQKARSEGLRTQLEILGFSIEKVEALNFSSKVNIYAPIGGFVTKIGTSSGSFLNASDVALQITNLDHLHIELDVFEKDIDQVHKGQMIHFRVSGTQATTYEADVYLIGSIVEGENRVVRVHGHLEDEDSENSLLPGMYVEAEIITESEETNALPEAAVVRVEDSFFILVQKEFSSGSYTFERIEVHPGRTTSGMVEIPDAMSLGGPILVKGAFNLIQVEEGGGHSH